RRASRPSRNASRPTEWSANISRVCTSSSEELCSSPPSSKARRGPHSSLASLGRGLRARRLLVSGFGCGKDLACDVDRDAVGGERRGKIAGEEARGGLVALEMRVHVREPEDADGELGVASRAELRDRRDRRLDLLEERIGRQRPEHLVLLLDTIAEDEVIGVPED